jgi:hypothetical protein
MLLNRQRANRSDAVLADNAGKISATREAARISQVPKTPGSPGSKDHLRFGLTSAARRLVRWTWRDADDRKVFNVWALWVVAFYASLAIALLVAMLGIGR